MPIAFPAFPRGRPAIKAQYLTTKPAGFVPAPNRGNPGVMFFADTLGPGRGQILPRANPRSPGVNFAKAFMQHDGEPRPQVHRSGKLWIENDGILRTTFTGISRDAADAPLGGCQVMIFRTVDRLLVGETISDGGGNWSIDVYVSGPFFQVDYKSGAPDVTGASLNTLIPVAV